MSESVCRLSVGADGEIADLILPAGTTVDSLLPDVVALAHPHAPDGVSWRLDRASGGPIDGSLSLRQNGVHDGDVLQLLRGTIPELGVLRTHTATMAMVTRSLWVHVRKALAPPKPVVFVRTPKKGT